MIPVCQPVEVGNTIKYPIDHAVETSVLYSILWKSYIVETIYFVASPVAVLFIFLEHLFLAVNEQCGIVTVAGLYSLKNLIMSLFVNDISVNKLGWSFPLMFLLVSLSKY